MAVTEKNADKSASKPGPKARDAFRTISEAAVELGVQAHVLRFWESRFPQISPLKRAGGRRFYRHNDLALLRGIKRLLHDEGFTIKGAKKHIRDQGVAAIIALGEGAALSQPAAPQPAAPQPSAPAAGASAPLAAKPAPHAANLKKTLRDLEAAKARLDAALKGEQQLL